MKYKTIKRGLHFYKSKGQFYWHIGGRNGKILASSSEGFKTLASAVKNFKATADAMFSICALSLTESIQEFKEKKTK